MTSPATIDLSKLPAPEAVIPVDFETVLRGMLNDLRAKDDGAYDYLSEADPIVTALEYAAHLKVLMDQRINDAVRAVLLSHSRRADLDNLVAFYNIERQVVVPGDPNAIPPIPDVKETDTEIRQKALLMPQALSVAGPHGAYKYHAMSAGRLPTRVDVSSPSATQVVVTYTFEEDEIGAAVRDASVDSPSDGVVKVVIQSRHGDGVPTPELVAAVQQKLMAGGVRPLTDHVICEAAELVDYSVEAEIFLYPGTDQGLVYDDALSRLRAYIDESFRLGYDITRSGIFAALHTANVQNVLISHPATDVVVASNQVARCTNYDDLEDSITIGGFDV